MKRKKLRGSNTAGRGIRGGRGAGKRGGHGKAGWHKHKLFYMLKYYPEHFGKDKFRCPSHKEDVTINLEDIIKYEKDGVVNLVDLGYTKLLSMGTVNKKLKVIVNKASKKALHKILQYGGEVVNARGEKIISV